MRCVLLLLTSAIVGDLTLSSSAAEPPKRIDVSAIIAKGDAEKILGQPVKQPTPLQIETSDGFYSKCNYYSTKSVRSLLLRVREATEGTIDPQKQFDQLAVSGGAIKPVDDLGDRAGMLDPAPENGLPANVIMLYVVKGKYFITVGLAGFKDEAAALDKAKEISRKIIAQL